MGISMAVAMHSSMPSWHNIFVDVSVWHLVLDLTQSLRQPMTQCLGPKAPQNMPGQARHALYWAARPTGTLPPALYYKRDAGPLLARRVSQRMRCQRAGIVTSCCFTALQPLWRNVKFMLCVRSWLAGCAGEASSNTFTSANGIYLRGFRGNKPWAQWAGAAGTNATMPALLREAQPYLRLILMLRNPVTRWGLAGTEEWAVTHVTAAASNWPHLQHEFSCSFMPDFGLTCTSARAPVHTRGSTGA